MMNNEIWLAIIGVFSLVVGLLATKIEIKPQIEKQKHDSEIFKQKKTEYLFEKYEEDNKTLREEIVQIKKELKELELIFEKEEKKLNKEIEALKEELELSKELSFSLESDLKESYNLIEELTNEPQN